MNRSMAMCATVAWALVACSGPEDVDNDESVEGTSQALQAGTVLTFKNHKSNRCIGVDGASTANGALIKQFSCDNAPNQKWRVQRNGAQHTFINFKSGLCMGVDHASVSPGANIAQFNCGNNAPNQSWVLASDAFAPWNIDNVKSGLCIGVDGASTGNGAQLKQFGCDLAAANQEWFLIEQ